MSEATILVRMNEMALTRNSARLKTTLGSCVGIILRDPVRKVSGLAHIMLPECVHGDPTVGKYADTAIPLLLERVLREGGRRGSLQAYIVGGACMFPFGPESQIAQIGDRNVEAARAVLGGLRIPVVYADTGGSQGRTLIFDNGNGQVDVRTVANPLAARKTG
jgi:chemotaxis protein CheD